MTMQNEHKIFFTVSDEDWKILEAEARKQHASSINLFSKKIIFSFVEYAIRKKDQDHE
jgi:hypothetical protein